MSCICNRPAALGLNRVIPDQFSSDKLWSYEIGTKKTFFKHKLQIERSHLLHQWKNIQQNVYLRLRRAFTPNLGKAKSKGGDVEVISWRATHDLTLGLYRARLTNLLAGSCYDIEPTPVASRCRLRSTTIATQGDALLASPWTFAGRPSTFTGWTRASHICGSTTSTPHGRTASLRISIQDSEQSRTSTRHCQGCRKSTILSVRAGVRFNGLDCVAVCAIT